MQKQKTWTQSILLLALYSIPASFLAMYGDAEFRNMLLYILPMIGLPVLARFAGKSHGFPILLLGNLLSFASSIVCIFLFQSEYSASYFKPFTPVGLMTLVTAISFIIQLAVWRDARTNKKK